MTTTDAPIVQRAKVRNFGSEPIRLENGAIGRICKFESQTPAHWAHIIDGTGGPKVTLDGQLFLPAGATKPSPVVIVVPGSTGVNTSQIGHARTLTSMGIGAFVVDYFSARGIIDTYKDQRQLTFCAGSYDVLAATAFLMDRPEIDARRIGAMGGSRGGTQVIKAATRQLADVVLGKGRALRSVLSQYPSGIFQFASPRTGDTVLRIVMGDSDKWTMVSVVQGYANAIRLCGGRISMRIWRDAEHSFDRPETPLHFLPEGVETSQAPVYFLNDQGQFLSQETNEPLPGLTEVQLRLDVHARFAKSGCSLGSKPGQPESFKEDMTTFFKQTLLQ